MMKKMAMPSERLKKKQPIYTFSFPDCHAVERKRRIPGASERQTCIKPIFALMCENGTGDFFFLK